MFVLYCFSPAIYHMSINNTNKPVCATSWFICCHKVPFVLSSIHMFRSNGNQTFICLPKHACMSSFSQLFIRTTTSLDHVHVLNHRSNNIHNLLSKVIISLWFPLKSKLFVENHRTSCHLELEFDTRTMYLPRYNKSEANILWSEIIMWHYQVVIRFNKNKHTR